MYFTKQHSPDFAYTNMCSFGMRSSDEHGTGLVYKPTRFMRASWLLINALSKYVCNRRHRHVHLMHGRAAAAAVYPERLCSAICRGIKDQLEYDELYSRVKRRLNVTNIDISSVVGNKYQHNDE